ncbi:hypothetical protein [Paenibacillus sacheonensis]
MKVIRGDYLKRRMAEAASKALARYAEDAQGSPGIMPPAAST